MHKFRSLYLCLTIILCACYIAEAQEVKKRQTPVVPNYLDYIGSNIENIWGDLLDVFPIPIIYLDAPQKSDKPKTAKKEIFSIKEYTQQVASESDGLDEDAMMREADDLAIKMSATAASGELTPYPSEYKIWNNGVIDAYNVNLAETKDTIRIDISDYQSPGYRYVTSEFGWRRRRMHYGIDLKVYTGDTIRSAFDNAVVRIKRFNRRGYGHYIVLRHANGLETLYGHLSKPLVEEGDTLRVGDVIGLGGSTGRSSGAHLHFEIRYLGKAINPKIAIDFENNVARNNILVLTADNFKYSSKQRGNSKTKSASGGSNATGPNTIVIRKGDTLGAIARRYGTTVAKLKKLNGLKSNNITAGKRLKIR